MVTRSNLQTKSTNVYNVTQQKRKWKGRYQYLVGGKGNRGGNSNLCSVVVYLSGGWFGI